MSDLETEPLPTDDLAPLPTDSEQASIDVVEAAPITEDPDSDLAGAVEIRPNEKYVPVGVIRALREELKALKPKAEQADRLEQENANFRPYVQFLQANPHLLQPQQPQQAPAQAPTKADPLVEATAKRYDLYTPDGKLDLERAASIVDDQRRISREEAQAVMQPLQQQSHQSQLQANIQWMTSLKTADGQALEAEYIHDTVKSIYGALPQAEALKVLADPKVAQVIGYVALGRQASIRKGAAAPHPAPGPALVVESAGGSSDVRISDGSRKLFDKAGISEKDATAAAKRFKPGVANVLE